MATFQRSHSAIKIMYCLIPFWDVSRAVFHIGASETRTKFNLSYKGNSASVTGTDRILYETDFPHPTSMCPGPAAGRAVRPDVYIQEGLGHLPNDIQRKILHDNAADLYRIQS